MRKALLMAPVVAMCVFIMAGYARAQGSPEEEAGLKQFAEILKKKVTLDCDEERLDGIFTRLKDQTKVNFVIDPEVQPTELRGTVQLKDVALGTALRCILNTRGLDFWFSDGIVMVATADTARSRQLAAWVYDVSDMTAQVIDWPQISDFSSPVSDGMSMTLSGEDLREYIKSSTPSAGWDNEGCSIDFSNGKLFVRNTPAVHAMVRQIIDDVRGEVSFQIKVTGHLVEVEPSVAMEAVAKGRGMSAEAAAKLLDAARAKGKVRRSFTVNCLNGQLNGMSSRLMHGYVKDYDTEIAAGAVVYDPVMGTVAEGYTFEFRPQADANGSKARVEVRAIVGDVALPIQVFTSAAGDLQLPKVVKKAVSTTLDIANGAFTLLDMGASEESALNICLLVGISIAKKEKTGNKTAESAFKDRMAVRQAMFDRLASAKMSVKFKNERLSDVFDFLRENTNINFFITDVLLDDMNKQDMRLTLTLKDTTAKNVLDVVTQLHPVRCDVIDDVVAIVSTDSAVDESVVKLYYVADFLSAVRDFVSPALDHPQDWREEAAGASCGFSIEEAPVVAVTSDQLVELIKANVAPQSWDQPYASISVTNGLLIVRHVPEVQVAVEKYIAKFRGALTAMINFDVRVLEVDNAHLVAIMKGEPTDKVQVTDSVRDGLISDALQNKGAMLWRGFNLTCMNAEKVMAYSIAQHSMVADYDVEVAENAKGYDPIISVLSIGAAVQFTAVVDGTGKGVKIEIRNSLASMKAGGIETFKTSGGDVQIATSQHSMVSLTAMVPDGQTVLIPTTMTAPNLQDGVVVILVRPSIVK